MSKTAILCIDDEPTILDSLRIELELAFGDDHLIEMAQDGEEALEVFSELLEDEYEVPLVISDCIMPGMKGDELLKTIHEISPKTIKIMLTGQAGIESVANAINFANLYRYIAKPWQVEDFNLTVKEAINSYLNSQKLEKQNIKLFEMNKELEELNQKQSKLIVELHNKEEKLKQLNKSYQRFVPQQFIQRLQKESIVDVELGDQVQQEMSVVFSDIRNFTSLSETMSPKDNFKFINAYLSRMEPAILNNKGFIDKYIGDAIMALFSGEADDAVKASISMLNILTEYNKIRKKEGRQLLKIGIGINTGSLMLGTVGGQFRMDSTVISDAVNLAARLEGLTKQYKVSLLISHETFSRLHNPFEYNIRFIDRVQVKGKSKKVSVFEVFDADPPEIREGKLATKSRFEEALFLGKRGNFKEAEKILRSCWKQNPGDTVTQIYLERSQEHFQHA